MRASDFLSHYGVTVETSDAERPENATQPDDGRAWFRTTFTHTRADGVPRSVSYVMTGGLHDTLAQHDPLDALYFMAQDAYYGESYEELRSDYGDNAPSRESWLGHQAVVRTICRAWVDSDAMWEDLLSIEPDQTSFPAR